MGRLQRFSGDSGNSRISQNLNFQNNFQQAYGCMGGVQQMGPFRQNKPLFAPLDPSMFLHDSTNTPPLYQNVATNHQQYFNLHQFEGVTQGFGRASVGSNGSIYH